MHKYCLFAAALALAGCTTPQAQPGSPAWFMKTPQSQQIAFFKNRCVAYGFQPGTTAMAQCIQNDSNSAKERANQRLMAISSMPTTTSCSNIGGFVNCHTY